MAFATFSGLARRALRAIFSLRHVAHIRGQGGDEVPPRGHVAQMVFLPVGAGDQIAATGESVVQDDRRFPGFRLFAGGQASKTDGPQVTGWGMERLLNSSAVMGRSSRAPGKQARPAWPG